MTRMTLAQNYANLDKCGPAFQAAIAALDNGHDVRLSFWPEGKFLRLEKTGFVGIYRDDEPFQTSWDGREGQHDLRWEIMPKKSEIMSFKKIGDVSIFGVQRPVMQREDGRMFAGDSISEENPRGMDGRAWNGMTMEILKERIQRTEKAMRSI